MNDGIFMMSKRFDKDSPEDFGLLPTCDADIFICPQDRSLWKKRSLYDFGWGQENGYQRLPLAGFEELVDVIRSSDCQDDRYGAAAVILEDHCEELLPYVQEILKDREKSRTSISFFRILQLENPVNRSVTSGKSYQEISEDYEKWKVISTQVLECYKMESGNKSKSNQGMR